MGKLKKAAILLASLVILLSFASYFMQKKLIFLPTKLTQDYTYEFDTPFEEFFIETEDGASLNALHFKAENPKGVILYFHGNADDLSRWGEETAYFTEYGYDVVIMDYRTYGKSTGEITEKALYSDAQLFYDWVLTSYKEENIIVYGRSLGSTLATYITSKNNAKKLILETPFYNLTEAVKHRIPVLPVSYFLKFKFPSNKFITKVKCPVVIFHGTDDDVVPFSSGQKLSKLVPKERLTFITIPGGKHKDLIDFPKFKIELKKVLK